GAGLRWGELAARETAGSGRLRLQLSADFPRTPQSVIRWSRKRWAVGQWEGVPLADVLRVFRLLGARRQAGPQNRPRAVSCDPRWGSGLKPGGTRRDPDVQGSPHVARRLFPGPPNPSAKGFPSVEKGGRHLRDLTVPQACPRGNKSL
ncbi:hypothetical protein P7K49_015171, partial [Saguinus oedipus]